MTTIRQCSNYMTLKEISSLPNASFSTNTHQTYQSPIATGRFPAPAGTNWRLSQPHQFSSMLCPITSYDQIELNRSSATLASGPATNSTMTWANGVPIKFSSVAAVESRHLNKTDLIGQQDQDLQDIMQNSEPISSQSDNRNLLPYHLIASNKYNKSKFSTTSNSKETHNESICDVSTSSCTVSPHRIAAKISAGAGGAGQCSSFV